MTPPCIRLDVRSGAGVPLWHSAFSSRCEEHRDVRHGSSKE